MANFTGTAAADDIIGTPDADSISAMDGNDVVNGLGGNDNIYGNDGDDFLMGGNGNDIIGGGGGNDVIDGGAGSDTLLSGNYMELNNFLGFNDLRGGAGNDMIYAQPYDTIDGGDGVDQLAFALNGRTVAEGTILDLSAMWSGGDGRLNQQTVRNIEILPYVYGSRYDDRLIIGDGAARSVILGGEGGNDELRGGGGNDSLDGGAGSDVLYDSMGADLMVGDVGDDHFVISHLGAHRIFGGVHEAWGIIGPAGTDSVTFDFRNATAPVTIRLENLWRGGRSAFGAGGTIDDVQRLDGVQFGGSGSDTISVGRSYTGVTNVEGGAGDDLIVGGSGMDTLVGDDGADRLYGGDNDDALDGGTGNDRLQGDAGTDALTGGVGDDILYGNWGTDTLAGGDGFDRIIGGAGADMMSGGIGRDWFYFDDGDFGGLTGPTADRITDFSHADRDKIRLDRVDADLNSVGVDDAFTFIGTARFSGVAGELRYFNTGGNTYVQGDQTGDGVGDFMIRLDGTHALVISDFFLL